MGICGSVLVFGILVSVCVLLCTLDKYCPDRLTFVVGSSVLRVVLCRPRYIGFA